MMSEDEEVLLEEEEEEEEEVKEEEAQPPPKEIRRPYLNIEPEQRSIDNDDDETFPTANEEMARRAGIFFRCVECNYFKPEKDNICHCGETEEYHAKFTYSSTDDVHWHPDCLETIPKTNAVGKVNFTLADAADNLAYYVRVATKDNLQHVMEFITTSWKILQPTRPKLCISILTAPFENRISEDSKNKFIKEIIDTLRGCDSLLINNGLNNASFNYIIGKELSKLTTTLFGDDMAFVPPKIIGVTPWGCVAARHMFVDVDHKYREVNYKNVTTSPDNRRVPLLPFNSAFIFGDDGHRGNYKSFVQSKFRASFEKKILSAKNAQGLSVPVVDMVIGGDLNTLREAANAVEENISLLVCKGTGGTADLLDAANDLQAGMKGKETGDTQKFNRMALKLRAQKLYHEHYTEEVQELIDKMFKKILENPELIIVYDIDGEAKLSSELMSSIMMHASDTLGKLYLTLSWRNYELANSVTRKKLEDIQPRMLYGLMLTALLNSELEFVKLFIRLGVQIDDFVTVDILHSLYNFSRNRQTFVSNLHNGHCDQTYSSSVPPTLDKLEKNKGGGRVVLSRNAGGGGGGGGGGFLQAAFTSFLGHIADKKVQSYMDALREEEELRLMRADQSTIYLAAVENLIDFNFICEPYTLDIPMNFNRSIMSQIRIEEPADHLTIWAILHGRQEMALYFLSLSRHPIYLSIFGASIYRDMATKVASYDTKTMEMYKANADEIELDGLHILDLCDSKDPIATEAILLEYKPYWARMEATIAAATSNSFKIVTSNAFQNVVTDSWTNGVHDNFMLVLATIICPILLITQEFMVMPDMKARIDFSKQLMPGEFLDSNEPKKAQHEKLDLTVKERFKQFYSSPMTNFAFSLISLLVFLSLFSYFLLFDLYKDHISIVEAIVMVYSIGWFIENISTCAGEQIGSAHSFFAVFQKFPWLPVYFVSDLLFLIAVLARVSESAFIVSVRAYSLQLIFNTAKLLYIMMLSPYYGPKVVMIKEMLKKLAVLAMILFIIMTAYGAAVQVLLYPTIDDFSTELLVNIFRYPYFQLFGELSFEFYNAEEPCNASTTTCPKFNVVVPILHAVYMLIAVLIFLNLLIAIFSQVFSDLLEQSREIWMQNRFRVVFYFRRVSLVPPPFSAIFMCFTVIYGRIKKCCNRSTKTASEKKAAAEAEMKKVLPAAMRQQTTWQPMPKNRNEYGYGAFLYRFQEFCRKEYYRSLEESGSASFDQQLMCINKRLEDLNKHQTDFSTRLPKVMSNVMEGKKQKTMNGLTTTRTWSQRLRQLNKIITGAEKKIHNIKSKVTDSKEIEKETAKSEKQPESGSPGPSQSHE